MRRLLQFFAEGILVLAPIALTVYVVGRIAGFLESLGERYLLLGLVRVPGVGLLVTVAFVTLVGAVAGHWAARRVIGFGEAVIERIPLVKGLYGSIRDVVDAFGGKKQSFGRAVLVRLPDFPLEILGFVTADDLALLGEAGRGRIAVYVPQSLQLGGFVAVVPRESVTVLEAPPQEVLRFLMTAGMAGR